jgi:hypothetical protein
MRNMTCTHKTAKSKKENIMESCDDYGTGIELSERMYKRVEWLFNIIKVIKNIFVLLRWKD